MNGPTITGATLRRYLRCHRLPFMERFGAQLHEPTRMAPVIEEQPGADHPRDLKRSALAWQVVRHNDATEIPEAPTATEAATATLAAMRNGDPLIAGGVIGIRNWWGRPTVLRRIAGKSKFGEWMYCVVEDRRTAKTSITTVAIVAAFYAEILKELQSAYPVMFTLWQGYFDEPRTMESAEHRAEMLQHVEALTHVLSRNDPGPEIRTSVCSRCDFQTTCDADARRMKSLSLLTGTTRQTKAHFERHGILDLESLRLHPDAERIVASAPQVRHHAAKTLAQAKLYVSGEVSVVGTPSLPSRGDVELFIDFEGEGLNNRTDATVFGLLIRTKRRKPRMLIQVAASANATERNRAWKAFLRDLRAAGAHPVFHFGTFDRTMMEGMLAAYGGPKALLSRLVDVHDSARRFGVIADRSSSAKAFAKSLNVPTRHPDLRGEDAPVLWREWVATRALKTRRQLVEYNEDDLLALMTITDGCGSFTTAET